MILLQAISVLFALFMFYMVRIHHKKKHLESFEYGMWAALWVVFLLLAVFPQSMQGIVERIHIARVFDLLVVISLMIIVLMTFFNRIAVKKMEKKFENLIRKRAIDTYESPTKN